MGHQDALPREEMIDFVMSCWDEEAGEHESALHFECEANGEIVLDEGAFGPHLCSPSRFHFYLSNRPFLEFSALSTRATVKAILFVGRILPRLQGFLGIWASSEMPVMD